MRGTPPPPTGRPRGGSGRKKTALTPPCPERGPEAGRTRIKSHYYKHLNQQIQLRILKNETLNLKTGAFRRFIPIIQ